MASVRIPRVRKGVPYTRIHSADMIVVRHAVTDAELSSLAQTYDIISIGVLADELRRRLHGTKTTFVRVAMLASDVGAPMTWPAAAGELRIVGVPASRAAAVQRVGEVAAAARGAAVTAFSLADLEPLSAR